MSREQLYYLISSILSLKVNPTAAEHIAERFPKKVEDWQRWVQMGSKHLVLQSLYLSLKNNELLGHLPNDLVNDLEHFHSLNLKRNRRVIEQSKRVQELLKVEGIECVLMKGVANILDGLYLDIGERMVYDIDILVEEDKMLNAAEILLSAGYKTQKDFNPKAYPSTMHYPILLKEDEVTGVELHRLPVQYHYLKSFSSKQAFETRKRASNERSIWVMSDENKLIHNFIHSQLMHNGHYHADVSLRNLYDMLLLGQREDVSTVFGNYKYHKAKTSAYLTLMNKVFGLPSTQGPSRSLTTRLFLARHSQTLRLSRRKLAAYHFVITAFIKYVALPFRTLFDRNARNYVFSRLGNRHWYKQHFDAYRRKFSN